MAAASVASARSTPATNRPSEANAAVPSTSASRTAPTEACGDQPSAKRDGRDHRDLEHLDEQEGADLAEQQPERGSGEEPSRLSTP